MRDTFKFHNSIRAKHKKWTIAIKVKYINVFSVKTCKRNLSYLEYVSSASPDSEFRPMENVGRVQKTVYTAL
jgi:hypothetical protein